jgi:hypothetical protein
VSKGKIVKEKSRQDKGFGAEINAFFDHILSGKKCPIPFSESVASTLATIALVESCRSNTAVEIGKIGSQ